MQQEVNVTSEAEANELLVDEMNQNQIVSNMNQVAVLFDT